jgi:hypothetical protein
MACAATRISYHFRIKFTPYNGRFSADLKHAMKTLPRFDPTRMRELERAWRGRHEERSRKRLQVIRLVVQHRRTAWEIAQALGMGCWTVFNYVRKFQDGGVKGLLATSYAGRAARGSVDEATEAELRGKLEKGEFKRGVDAQACLAGRGASLALKTVYYWLKKSRRGFGNAAQNPRQKRRGPGRGLQTQPRRRTAGAGARA